MNENEQFDFPEAKSAKHNHPGFVGTDPISIPHRFSDPHDIEIAAFLTAVLAWGQRKAIIRNAFRLMDLMERSPYEFLNDGAEEECNRFPGFVHRALQPADSLFFLRSLQRMVREQGGIKPVFVNHFCKTGGLEDAIRYFRQQFFRRMVRNNGRGIGFRIVGGDTGCFPVHSPRCACGNCGRKTRTPGTGTKRLEGGKRADRETEAVLSGRSGEI